MQVQPRFCSAVKINVYPHRPSLEKSLAQNAVDRLKEEGITADVGERKTFDESREGTTHYYVLTGANLRSYRVAYPAYKAQDPDYPREDYYTPYLQSLGEPAYKDSPTTHHQEIFTPLRGSNAPQPTLTDEEYAQLKVQLLNS